LWIFDSCHWHAGPYRRQRGNNSHTMKKQTLRRASAYEA
jgi:hypothetical protein